jgi:AcrR family transcriptional regulator
VFWRQGYEGTSLTDLTTAMGVNRPSLYAVFGSKEDLFRKAFARYAERDMAYARAALDKPTAFEVAQALLRDNAAALTRPGRPAGCLSIQGGPRVRHVAFGVPRESLAEQVVLGPEHRVQAGPVHAHRGREIGQGGAFVALAPEHLDGPVQGLLGVKGAGSSTGHGSPPSVRTPDYRVLD